MSRYSCPNCGSEHTMSYATIYNNGVTEYQSDGTFDGYTEDFRSVSGNISSRGTMVSNLAQSCAPPKKPNIPGIGSVILNAPVFLVLSSTSIGLVLGTLKSIPSIHSSKEVGAALVMLFFAALAGVAALILFYGIRRGIQNTITRFKGKIPEEEQEWYEELYDWECSYICMRCGHRFKHK